MKCSRGVFIPPLLSFSHFLPSFSSLSLSHPIVGFRYCTHSRAVMKYPVSAAVAFSKQLPQNEQTNISVIRLSSTRVFSILLLAFPLLSCSQKYFRNI